MENGNAEESQTQNQKFKRFSKRNIYMKRKDAESKSIPTEEPKEKSKEVSKEESKEEQNVIQVNKISTQKENSPYNHRSLPKLKVKNKNTGENNDLNHNTHNTKESKRFKSPLSFSNSEELKEQIISSKITNIVTNEDNIGNNIDKGNSKESNPINNINIIKNETSNNEDITVNDNKITVNLKKDNDTNNKIITNENTGEKINNNKNILSDNPNTNINKGQKLKSNTDEKANDINIISSTPKEKEISIETKNNKSRNKLDSTKDQSKSLLAGGPKKECPICHSLIESHLYKIHVKNVHISQVLSWLYLGSFANACDLEELRRNNIKYILNCAVECKNENLPSDIKELHLKLVDEPEFDITKYFKQTNDFINKVRTAGGNLLVHCKVGLSRSPTVIIAYLMKYYEFTADSAINYIKRKRPQIIPNQGFIKQLYEYEKQFEKKFKKKAKK